MINETVVCLHEWRQQKVAEAYAQSHTAKLVQLVEAIGELRNMLRSPPSDWPSGSMQDCLEQKRRVVSACRDINPRLVHHFDELYHRGMAELSHERSARSA